jgi:hypothetical protein
MLAEPLKVTYGAAGFHGTRFENHWSRLALMPTHFLVSRIPNAFPRGANWPNYEADYPPQNISEIKNVRSCTSTRLFGLVLD